VRLRPSLSALRASLVVRPVVPDPAGETFLADFARRHRQHHGGGLDEFHRLREVGIIEEGLEASARQLDDMQLLFAPQAEPLHQFGYTVRITGETATSPWISWPLAPRPWLRARRSGFRSL